MVTSGYERIRAGVIISRASTDGLTVCYRIEIVYIYNVLSTFLQHFTCNEIQFPTAARRWIHPTGKVAIS